MVLSDAASGAPTVGADKPEPKLRVVEASKVYASSAGPVHALDGLSLDVLAGRFVCLLGPSGCGKTTLLWAMTGLHALTSGQVLLDGAPVDGPRPDDIGIVFQEPNLLPWRTLRANIEFPSQIRHAEPDGERIARLLEQTRLSGFENARPRELSGGMQQRASIVRALAQDPSVLLMDEPFSALDAFTRDEMELMLLELWEQNRQTIVFVTHNIAEAVLLADTVVVMSARPGRVSRVIDVDLPRPRTAELTFEPAFVELTHEIRAAVDARGAGRERTR
jgi:NitT/TauT family transport system ATP-binding protein